MNNRALLFCLSGVLMSGVVHAATQEIPSEVSATLPTYYGLPQQTHTAGSKSSVPAQSSESPVERSLLPIWGDEARARGYELPEPFGINVNYMNMRQNIVVDSISFSGLEIPSFPGLPGVPLPSDFINIKVGNTRQQSKTETIKLDAWLFPFMNIYGVVGHTRGSSLSKIDVLLRDGHTLYSNIDFKLNFKGTTYGAGTVFAGGYGNWFGLVDMNYTQTRFDILDGSIDAFTLSPRVGYRFITPGIDTIGLPNGKLSLWVGSMYQDVQQEFKGNINDLSMPSELQGMIDLVNTKGQGRFDVRQHLSSPWNVLIGAQYEITRNFNLTTEVGFAERNSFFIAGEYRF
ncbi:hypothetical protein I6G97_04195 [Edwardsiella hoshinae]|uniref:Lipoprotein n=1 Tax=Edwardsiella hoshinae TaxID=93378 RepID=A0A376DNS6_9GAMM|nr:hypothetical protein [Edwardsiella hoshinae]QPR28825.1 hypothetical protein I6G97_04195 [Edwardsiella hoshinae]STC92087.1 Uncharacterised protein [Edwardsiella hoshinae]